MRLGSTRRYAPWIAVLATYALALQLVFGPSVQARPAAADLPTILCAGHGVPDHAPAAPHPLPDCCLHGCCALASLWIAPPRAIPVVPRATYRRAEPPWLAPLQQRRSDGDPRLTRGPPRQA